MSYAAKVRSEIAKASESNPVTNNQLSQLVGRPSSSVAVVTGTLFKQGRVARKTVGKTPSGIEKFGYFPVAATSKPARTHKHRNSIAKVSNEPNAQGSLDVLIDTLAKQMADQVIVRLKSHLSANVALLAPPVPPTPEVLTGSLDDLDDLVIAKPPKAPEPVVVKDKLRKVVVIGLLPQQAGLIQSEFHDTFDLSFWQDGAGGGINKLKAVAAAADMVFVHTRHISHAVTDAIKVVRVPVTNVNGGMTQLRDALTKYYVVGA